jgi:hypothetical protein
MKAHLNAKQLAWVQIQPTSPPPPIHGKICQSLEGLPPRMAKYRVHASLRGDRGITNLKLYTVGDK